MLTQNHLEIIKKTIEEFFQKMTFEVDIELLSEKEKTLPINLRVKEPQILIGEGGQTLLLLQHILKAIFRKKLAAQGEQELFYIDLDINDYKKKKIEYLKELAREMADEVALTKKEKVLSPMSAYERRIIHLELAGRGDVTTESIGQEPERRVVIRSYP